MADTINGTGKPKFELLLADNTILNTYTFPRCGIGGAKKYYKKDSVITELENGRLTQDCFGYRNRYVLDYSAKLQGDYCLQLMEILNAELDGVRIRFTCHDNALNIQDEVFFTNAELLLELLASGSDFVSMKGIVLEMIAVDLQRINWIDTTNITHAVMNFTATN